MTPVLKKIGVNHTAEIVRDTIYDGNRIVSFHIWYPRFILPEVNTHRIITKSTASSRAIPVKKRIKQVNDNPYVPAVFYKNKPGMVGNEPAEDQDKARACWIAGARKAVETAQELLAQGLHKDIANRVIEPYVYVDTILTATEWDNFFALRTSEKVPLHYKGVAKNANPEFKALADSMFWLLNMSNSKESMYHLPYITKEEENMLSFGDLMLVSSARCARISYVPFDSNKIDINKDFKSAEKLQEGRHMSPFDHPSTGTPYENRQYRGWQPYRVSMEKYLGMEIVKDYR